MIETLPIWLILITFLGKLLLDFQNSYLRKFHMYNLRIHMLEQKVSEFLKNEHHCCHRLLNNDDYPNFSSNSSEDGSEKSDETDSQTSSKNEDSELESN